MPNGMKAQGKRRGPTHFLVFGLCGKIRISESSVKPVRTARPGGPYGLVALYVLPYANQLIYISILDKPDNAVGFCFAEDVLTVRFNLFVRL